VAGGNVDGVYVLPYLPYLPYLFGRNMEGKGRGGILYEREGKRYG
jgi:hypothetical protein